MSQIMLSTGPVYYTDSGGESAITILLLHANPGDSRDFEAVSAALADYGRVIALDWPGYGRSPLPRNADRLTVPGVYGVLQEFVQQLSLTNLMIVGNSLGGNVAVRLAAEYPQRVKGLVLVAPGGFTPRSMLTRLFCRWQGSPLALSPYRFARLYLKRQTPQTQAMLERARGEQAGPEQLTMNRALWRSFGSDENDIRAQAALVTAPVLLLFGRQDPVISARRDAHVAKQCLPHAQLVVLPCGHAGFAEVPQRFLEQVALFFAALGPAFSTLTETHCTCEVAQLDQES